MKLLLALFVLRAACAPLKIKLDQEISEKSNDEMKSINLETFLAEQRKFNFDDNSHDYHGFTDINFILNGSNFYENKTDENDQNNATSSNDEDESISESVENYDENYEDSWDPYDNYYGNDYDDEYEVEYEDDYDSYELTYHGNPNSDDNHSDDSFGDSEVPVNDVNGDTSESISSEDQVRKDFLAEIIVWAMQRYESKESESFKNSQINFKSTPTSPEEQLRLWNDQMVRLIEIVGSLEFAIFICVCLVLFLMVTCSIAMCCVIQKIAKINKSHSKPSFIIA